MSRGRGNAEFSDADSYELYMGRWSRQVAVQFLEWLRIPPRSSWLDVGSGTGALTGSILLHCDPEIVHGIERAASFVESAKSEIQDSRVRFELGDAQSLPVQTGAYDVVASGLVLNFLPDAGLAIHEMVRATKPGGVVAGYVWDYGGQMEIMRRFWDVAVTIDPSAARFDEGQREPPLCRPEILAALFRAAGLEDVKTNNIDAIAHFENFGDYWLPFTGGQGSAPTYVKSLDAEVRSVLTERVRHALPMSGTGRFDMSIRALGVQGRYTPTAS